MAKFCADDVYLGAFAVITNCNRQTVCSAQPADFAGIAAVRLAQVTMVYGVDWDSSAGEGTPAGMKLNVHAKSGLAITAPGTATHICFDNGTKLIYVTTCTNQQLSLGDTINLPRWSIELKAPV